MSDAFHNYERKLERTAAAIERAAITSANKQDILAFRDQCFSEGLSVARVEKYLGHLKSLASRLNKDFARAAMEDIQRLVRDIERADFSEWTKRDFRITLKKFYRWLRRSKSDPPEVAWLRSDVRNHRRKLPEEILTEQDVCKLIDACYTPRDKALVSVLYESGCRIGELASLRIKHVVPHPHGLRLIVDGKTGPRRVLVVSAAPYLSEWLNMHPRKSQPGAYVWVTRDCRGQRLSYARVYDILTTAARRAGITKPVNPHTFRHSRATYLASHFTEAQMNKFLGWVQGSDMPAVYVHLSGRDVDNALLKTYGIAPDSKAGVQTQLNPKPCCRCGLQNPPTNKFCSRCGAVLEQRTAREMIKRDLDRSRADQVMDRLIQDKEFRELLQRKLHDLDAA